MSKDREKNTGKKQSPGQLLLSWLYGGKDMPFFRQFRERIDKHNLEMAGHMLFVMTIAALFYFVLDLNSSESVQMRLSYLVCLLVAAVLLLLHEKLFKHIPQRIDITVYYIIVMELVFVFLLFVGPVFDPTHTACYLPVFFLVSFLLPILPLHYIGVLNLLNLFVFALVDQHCKTPELAKFDLINCCTCAAVGLALGRGILAGRLNEIGTYAMLQESSKREVQRAMHMVSTDSLTGVKSRAAYESAEHAVDQRIRAGLEGPFALVVADVNDLKKTNDTLGHEEGDALIIRCCRILCKVFAHSPVYRIGGDEFAVLLTGEDYENRAMLMESFRQKARLKGKGAIVAGGMSDYRAEEDRSMADVFRRADGLMYEDKHSGI